MYSLKEEEDKNFSVPGFLKILFFMRECKRRAEGGGRVREDTINVNQGNKL